MNNTGSIKTVLTFGEIMVRLNPPGYSKLVQTDQLQINFAGSEASVACNLANWDFSTYFFTGLPNNDLGEKCIRSLRALGTDISRIQHIDQSRMGVLFIESGANQRPSKVIYDRADSAVTQLPKLDLSLDEIFLGVDHFHVSGITPALSQGLADLTLTLLEYCRTKNITVSMDLNYRKNLWNYGKSAREIMPRLVSNVDILIGNEEDIQMMLAIGDSGNHSKDLAKSIVTETMNQYPNLELIALSNRQSISANHNIWSGMIYNGKEFYNSTDYDITHIVDRVGAGDSFASGIIAGYYQYPNDCKRIVDFATAASCLKHSIPGDFCLVDKDEIFSLMKGDSKGRIKR